MRAKCLLTTLAIVLSASSAFAQHIDPAAAERLFQDARSAVAEGHYDAACPMFAESYRLDPAPGTMLNLGDCEEQQGQLAKAWEHFRQVYDELPSSDERRAEAKARADAVEPRIPKLRVVATHGANVVRDGVTLGPASLGVSLPVDPGAHTIVVTAQGHQKRSYEVVLGEAEDREIAVEPGALEPRPVAHDKRVVAPAPVTIESANGQRTAGWVLATVGIGTLAAGGVLGVTALTKLSASNQDCVGNVCNDAAAVGRYQSARSFALATDITLGAGAVLVGTAIVLLLTSPHPSKTLARVSLVMNGGTW